VGYQATDTLAGTRIRTNLRDVGSSISVATKEFMRDIGATDSETLLQFMLGTEVGGSKGNFLVGSSVGDASTIDDTNARIKPQSNTRVRGLDSADNTRDFFLTDIPWNSYNTSRIDLQRGPNSILFGNGSGAGIINGSTDAATFTNTNTVTARYGSFGSYVGSINLNRELIKSQLAIRFAALNDNQRYQQKPAYNHDKRYYGAARFDPKFLKIGSARTSLKISYENGRIDANRPRLNTINDGITPWFRTAPQELRSPTSLGRAAGQDDTLLGILQPMVSHAGYDPFVTGINTASLISANPTRRDIGARAASSATNPNAEGWLGAQIKPSDQGGSQQNPGLDGNGNAFWLAVYDDPASSALSRYLYPATTTYNSVNSAGVRDGTAITGMRGPDYTGLLRLDQYASRGIGSFLYALQGVWRSQTISDPSVFDYFNKLLDGPNKSEGSKFDAFNAVLDQTFLNDKIGFQLAFDQQAYSDYRASNLSNPTLRIDIYKYLPVAVLNPSSGLMEPVLNPNFGRPYVISKPSGFRSRNTRQVARVTPYAEVDFKDIFKTDNLVTKVLGRHTFTGLYERSQFDRKTSSWVRYTLDAAQALAIFGPNQTATGSTRAVGTVTYLGPSLLNAPTLSGVGLSAITASQEPGLNGSSGVANGFYFDSTYNSATSPGAVYTPLALGLAPNQVGGAATTQNENLLNYNAWGSGPRNVTVNNSATGNERDLTISVTQVKNKVTSKALVDQWMLLNRHVIVTAGIRKDHIDTYFPGDPSVSATDLSRTGNRVVDNNTGLVDWSIPFTYANSPKYSFTSDWMKTYGVVLHAPDFINKRMPWGLQGSLFFNHSENFRPENRNDPLTGASLTPPTGETKEMGFAISTPKRTFSIRVNWYETKVRKASMPDNGVINFTADEIVQGLRVAKATIYGGLDINNGTNLSGGNPTLATNAPGTAGINASWVFRPTVQSSASSTNLDPSSTHYYPWQPSRAPTATQPWTLQEWKDAEAHALASANAFMDSLNAPEVQQMMSVWQINPGSFDYRAANFGINSITPQGLAVTGDTVSKGTEVELFFSPMDNWDITLNVSKTFATRVNLAGNMANWLQKRWDLYNESYTGAEGGLLVGAQRWFGNTQGNVNAGNARFGRNGYKFYSEFYSKEGNNVAELRPWRFNGVTSYRFTRGFMKGAFAGASYRWEDKSVIGYGITEATHELFDATGTVSVRAAVGRLDVNKPFYGSTESHVGLWVGYGKKIMKNLDWRAQLNVSNVGENTRLVAINVNPDGSGAAYRIAQGATWQLTNTFKF
jgi:hypothetical protein